MRLINLYCDFYKLLDNNYPLLIVVDEKGTTLRARDRYWQLWPPSNFIKFVPRGMLMLLTPDNLDALAAMVLLEDYLNHNLSWVEKPSFKTWPE